MVTYPRPSCIRASMQPRCSFRLEPRFYPPFDPLLYSLAHLCQKRFETRSLLLYA